MEKPDLLVFHIHQLLFNVAMGAFILLLIEFKLQNLAMVAKAFIPVKKQTTGMRPRPPLMMPGHRNGGRE